MASCKHRLTWRGLFLFLCLGQVYVHVVVSSGTLDLTELHSVQYSVEILDTPVEDTVEDTTDKTVSPSLTMVNKDGQKYRCSLPQMPDPDSTVEDNIKDQEPDIEKLLSPLEEAPCMYKTKDWWTYEVCYKRSVKQYHVENDKPVGAVLVLGVHSPDKDTWAPSNKTYQPQWYNNGSKCDLTGKPRQTELRFVCNEAATQQFIGDIFEPQSCEYTIVVHTSRICSVPWLRPVADPTPLPIVCNPMLSHTQMEKYKLYQERKKVADQLVEKERQAKKAAEMASPMGAKQVAVSKPGQETSLAGLLSSMGDNVADNLVAEINTLLEKAMTGEGNEGIKIVDLRDKNKEKNKEEKSEEKSEHSQNKIAQKPLESEAADGKWDLIHHKHQPISDPLLKELIADRNEIWRKTHEAKKIVKKYTSQLHDTETFLQREKEDTFENKEIVENLEQQKKTIEKALVKSRETVADLEDRSKDISHKIVAAQSRLQRYEYSIWKRKISVLKYLMKKGTTDYTDILKEIAKDYRKTTNERLTKINDYFKIAKKIVDDDAESIEKLQHFMQFADGELLTIQEDVELEDEIFEKELDQLTDDNIETAKKFRDVVKDDVKEKFSDILKEVSEELELPEGEVNKDEAMAAMSKTLDDLMGKLAGAGEKIDQVQKQVIDIKKISEQAKEASDDQLTENKEPRRNRADIMPNDDEEEDEHIDDNDDDETNDEDDNKLRDTMKQLKEAEAEVETLEKEFKELAKSDHKKEDTTAISTEDFNHDLDKVKVSVTNLSPGGDSMDTEQTSKIVKKLEGTIRDKLSKLGLDTGGRPIEVKLITTQIPEELGEGMEGESEDMQVQGMFFNMMTGNIQGYEDINSQRKVENNYKFTWKEESMDDIEEKIKQLGGGDDDTDSQPEIETKRDPEEIVLYDRNDGTNFYENENTEHPSLAIHTQVNEDDIDVDEEKHEHNKDEL